MPKRQKLLIAFILLGALCSLCAFFPIAFYLGEDLTCWLADNLPNFFLEDTTHFRRPPSASSLTVATRSSWNDCELSVRFEMSPGDLDGLVATTQVTDFSSDAARLNEFFQRYGVRSLGWNLSNVSSYQFGYVYNDYFDQQYLFVDTSDPSRYVVYILTYQGFLD